MICGVSPKRVRRWIEKNELKTCRSGADNAKVLCEDLVNFLVQYNMSIPESIIPFEARKILFVLPEEILDDVYYQFVLRFFEKIKKQANFIVDYITYGPNVKMKLMVFRPDLVLLDTAGAINDAVNLIETIRGNEQFSAIRLMAITEDNREQTRDYVKRLGIDSTVPRSIEITPLIDKIKKLL